MLTQVEIGDQIDFITHIGPGPAGGIAANGRAAGVVQRVAGGVEPKDMILHHRESPLGRVEGKLHVQIIDILPPDQVQEAEVVMYERKELIESAMPTAGRPVVIARSPFVITPEL